MGVLASARPAQAALLFRLEVVVDGNADTTAGDYVLGTDLAGHPQITFNHIFGGVAFNVQTTTTNSPGTLSLASLTMGSSTISTRTADGGDGAAHVILLKAYADGYMLPATPPALDYSSSGGGSVTTGTLVSGSTQAYVSHYPGANGTVFDTTGTLADTGFYSPKPASGTTVAYTGASGDQTISSLLTPYQLTLFTNLSLGADTALSGNTSNVTLTSVPEPAAIAMAVSGLPVLGLFWVRRRVRA